MLDRLVRTWTWLDPVAEWTQNLVGAIYRPLGAPGRLLRNLLHGTFPLGHPLHPAMTDIPIGAWTVGVLFDWLWVATGRVPAVAGDIALAAGLLVALVAVVSGYTDFHDTFALERRTAILHGLTMTAIVIIEFVSLALRLGGPSLHVTAIVISTIAWLTLLVGAYIGGHISFYFGSAVNHDAFFDGPTDYVRVGAPGDFVEGEMKRVDASGLPVVLLRRNGTLCAIGAVCSHAGGPLDEGKVDANGVVTCPWHGSRFRFENGQVVGGPGTFDVPQLLVREQDGGVEVKLPFPLH